LIGNFAVWFLGMYLERQEFGVEAFDFSGRRPDRDSPLNFGAAYPLVIFFTVNF
jgi:hypothetical protein